MTATTRAFTLVRRPDGPLRSADLAIAEHPLPPVTDGDVLIRNTWLSIDPSIRIRLAGTTPAGYLPPFAIGEPLAGLALGVVQDSRSSDYPVGQLVSHMYGYRDYAVVRPGGSTIGGYGALARVDPQDFPVQWFLGPLGSSGLTAYAGVVSILGITSQDTIWVSAAAGAVGSLVAQLARVRGATVIGSAGSSTKVDHLLRDLRLDAAFDYHRGPLVDLIDRAAPEGISAYFDSVGGDHLTAALNALRPGGRVALCGAISGYDTAESPPGPNNLFQLVSKGIRMEGYRAGSFNHLMADMQAEIGAHLTTGRMVFGEHVFHGLEQAGNALISMLGGYNTGKTLVNLDGEGE
ncbi:UNVERIFIED_ORG: hypothetical protein L601_001300000300 [Gordonia westfalica J30]